jgi:hypothetical protein
VKLPEPQAVKVGAEAIEFQVSKAEADALVTRREYPLLMEIFLSHELPTAVRFVADLFIGPAQGDVVAGLARFRELDPKLLDLMEKFVFRQHRRSIAQTKKTQPST